MDGHWLLTAVPDSSSGHNHDGTVAIGPSQWTVGRVGDALHFDGSSGSFVAPGGGPAVRTDQSFSVAAWVKLDRADGATHAAVSQDGSNVHGFLLGYLSEYQRFAFRMPAQDSTTGQKVAVQASGAPQVGVWTHLTGTYDVTSHQLRLYVNGVLQGTATMSSPWNAGGGVQIGRDRYGDDYTDNWTGAIDEVRIYDRVLSDLPSLEPGETAPRSEIGRLASPPVEEGYYPLDEGTGTAAGDVSGNYRTATLSGGAAWTTAGHISGALQLRSASPGAAATTGPAVRTDRSFTVAAEVRLDQAGTSTRAAVSQDGANRTHAFLLGYLSEYQRFAFRMLSGDSDAGQMVAVPATGAPRVGEWTHLAGTYDEASHELRLYVNGVLQGTATMSTPWNATGGLQIGRDKYHGQYADYFDGSIDEVHVDSGVLSDPQIAELSGQTEPRPPSLLAGVFERYASSDGRHYIGTGPVPPGYHLEGPLGMAAPRGAPNTRMIWSCRGFYLSQQANCSDGEVLGEAGLMYTTPPAGVPTQAVYRCLVVGTGDHFASFDPACESTPDKVRTEFQLGYTRMYAPLIRYVGPGGAHWTSTHGQVLPAGYRLEAVLGYVSMADVGQGPMLRLCQDGMTRDEFVSTDAACDGGQDLGTWPSGWLWLSPPAGVAESRPLYACRSGTGERFESLDRFCEGGTQVRQLGFVITQF
jgi:hypothetical protein